MNRLTSKLQNLKENNKKALVAYLVAGDPDLDTTLDLMHLFVDSGVDVIEIGVPFTDPIAEGPPPTQATTASGILPNKSLDCSITSLPTTELKSLTIIGYG